MEITKLTRYGIPQKVIDSWKRIQGGKLLPLQKEALTRYRLLEGESLLISAPTSSGKTFCGELAAVVNIFHRKKVVFLVPLKAIAEEKYADFCEKYSHLGIKVIISTRDRKECDRDLEKGDFDLAIVIYEKFNQVLIKNLDLLSQVNLLIVDELQMIGDISRGPVLELILTKIKNSKYHPQILGLSAVLSQSTKSPSRSERGKDAEELAGWLGLKLLYLNKRPVELHQGVLFDGKFHYRKYNSEEDEVENFLENDYENPAEILFACLEKLIKAKGKVLVFLKGKFDSEKLAVDFAERTENKRANNAISELSDLEPTSLKKKLLFCSLIFSTTTLSMGVNLPAKTVIIETQKYHLPEYSERTILCPVPWGEYENMSGRAGRLKKGLDFGRSIVIAANQFHFESLWEEYIETKEQLLSPGLYQLSLEDIILDLVTSGCAKDITRLKDVLCNTFSEYRALKYDQMQNSINEKTEFLLRENILLKDNGELFTSELGKTFVLSGITIKTGLAIKRMLDQNDLTEETIFIFNLLQTEDGQKLWVSLAPREEQIGFYEQMFEENFKLKSFLGDHLSLTSRRKRKLKLCFLFTDWISDLPTKVIEEKYNLRSGFIKSSAETLSWLLDASSLVARITQKQKEKNKFLKNLSQKILYGVDEKGLKLSSLRVPGMGRDFVWALVENNLYQLDKLKKTELNDLKKIIPEKVAQNLKETLSRKSQKKKKPQVKRYEPEKELICLVMDGQQEKGRFLIILNGKEIYLPAKSFSYLFKLAWAKKKTEDGWMHKMDLEPGENQAKYLYRLKNQIKSSGEFTQELIENNRTGSYRLDIPPEKIKFDLDNLKKIFDSEIKKMISEHRSL
ncbi:MAG: hypothetical protein AMJ90_08450 [candidate division Zixibacteria bacterium SM23_73_2]|nr:MAG: hypothetical protein AMJ90_08450 [candidate division Zixibacteria bacterium SM23_73_2]